VDSQHLGQPHPLGVCG